MDNQGPSRVVSYEVSSASWHVYPIRCFTCGKAFTNKVTDQFESAIQTAAKMTHAHDQVPSRFECSAGLSDRKWLEIGIKRICCRVVLLGTTERHD